MVKSFKYEKDYFNGTGYEKYGDFPYHIMRAEKLVRITQPKSVLDIGCAYGFIVKYLLDMGIFAIGMDVSRYAETQANKVIPNHFIRWDLRNPLPFPDNSFDVLYCEGVLEHIEEKYIEGIMKEFGRVAIKRYIQVSFDNHKDVEKEYGHILIKPYSWWVERIPIDTWLFLSEGATDTAMAWFYKG